MTKKQVLGRGMGALLKPQSNLPGEAASARKTYSENIKRTESNDVDDVIFEQPTLIPIEQIKINRAQPRKIFKEKEITELANSIRENGIIQPLILRKDEDGLLLIAGERRLRAAKLAGLERVPAVMKKATARETLIMGIIENVQRENLNCVEEALAYYQLMQDYELTQEEVAKKIGKERSSIANLLRLLSLPRVVIDALQAEKLTLGHGKILASLKSEARATDLAKAAIEQQLSVRELEELIKKENSQSRVTDKDRSMNPEAQKLDQLTRQLEARTGLHCHIKSSQSGHGKIEIKYSNKNEFNEIYDYLMK